MLDPADQAVPAGGHGDRRLCRRIRRRHRLHLVGVPVSAVVTLIAGVVGGNRLLAGVIAWAIIALAVSGGVVTVYEVIKYRGGRGARQNRKGQSRCDSQRH